MPLHLPHQELLSYINDMGFWSLLLSTESMASRKLYSHRNCILAQETGQTFNRQNEKWKPLYNLFFPSEFCANGSTTEL